MIVGVCGFGYSGSGAVLDLLKEYDECDVSSEIEFELPYCPYGLMNLDYYLNVFCSRFQSSDAAIYNFVKLIKANKKRCSPFNSFANGHFVKRSFEYLNSITQCSWNGAVYYDRFLFSKSMFVYRFRFARRFERFARCLKLPFKFGYKRKMYLSICPNDFLEITKKYVNDLLIYAGYDLSKVCVLNQPFPANNPSKCMSFFPSDTKAIVVFRDPRDVFLSAKYFVKDSASFIPSNVDSFVVYYRSIYSSFVGNNSVLKINFEDLIYKYEETKRLIEMFIGIHMHSKKELYFDLKKSSGNTMIFKKYPQFKKEVDYIEKELPEFLYNFESEENNWQSKPFNW